MYHTVRIHNKQTSDNFINDYFGHLMSQTDFIFY